LKKLRLERIINNKFNPLKICSKGVVNEFARITQKYEIIYCYTILEKNKKFIMFGKKSNEIEELKNDLNSFFVFEPFTLPNSSPYITPLYQDWKELEVIFFILLSFFFFFFFQFFNIIK